MKKQKNYYLGLDIGTDSVGYAATDESYNLLRFHGEPTWGSMIFDGGELKDKRRSFRSARRRLDRRQQRVKLLQEIFAKEIAAVDERFFIRLQESYKWRDDVNDKHIFFNDKNFSDAQYFDKYPTIHHLIYDLMSSKESHDVRLVYLACAWLVVHRGHFLNNIDVEKITEIRDVKKSYDVFCDFFAERGYKYPFEDVNIEKFGECLKEKIGVNAKKQKLTDILLRGQKPNKEISDELPYSTESLIKLLAGGNVKLKDLFGKEEYADLECSSITLGMEEEKYAYLMANIGEDYDIISHLRALYDWSVLADTLGVYETISEAKIAVYKQHQNDLKSLKYIVKKYVPEKYNEIFREAREDNYVAYSYNLKGLSVEEQSVIEGKATEETFCKYIKKIVKDIEPEDIDCETYEDMISRLDTLSFMPKQRTTDNRVILHQLYQYELIKILDNSAVYLPFLNEVDEGGLSVKEKIISIFLYKLPYYVGPLNSNSEYSWLKRREEGRILPWNYEQRIDLEASEQAFIDRMTNNCTYISGETVLPKDSLCYQRFNVLNEINNIRINGERISVELKQDIYRDLFEKKKKVRRKDIDNYLISHNIIAADEIEMISGIDNEIKSSLSTYISFKRLLDEKILSEDDVEKIVERASYAEDKTRVKHWLQKNYSHLSEEDCNYISRIKVKDFGRLSRAFLTQIESLTDASTGEISTILGAMWNTNHNLMELLSDEYSFMDEVQKRRATYYAQHPMTLDAKLDEMYISNSVRRSIYRTLDIVGDLNRAFGAPKKIFIEVTRGEDFEKKGKRTTTRRQQIENLYALCEYEEVRELKRELEAMGEKVDNKLQSEKLFLYFMQFGKCAYSDTPIDIDRLMNGSRDYDVEHIYPQAFVKDDSIINNKVLVLSKINGDKSNNYPIKQSIREEMTGTWNHWKKIGTISEEKYKRLTRKTPFSDEERYGFINRQLTETSQATKAVATLLKEKFPETEIVYARARLTSDFRKEYGLLKSRSYNDLHHAVDAYLNIVTGNVYNMKFSKKWFRLPEDNNYSIKTKTLFKNPLYCGNTLVWDGDSMLDKVKRTAMKNNAHFTTYKYYKKGELFDQNPKKKEEGLVPRKSGLSTEKYGGYKRTRIMFFLPVGYRAGSKSDVIVMPVEVLYGERVLCDADYAKEYAHDRLERIIGKKIDDISFPFGMRTWKINTMLSLDGFRACITGNANKGKSLIMQPVMQLSVGEEWKIYIKKIERFVEKNKNNPHFVYDVDYDVVSKEKNLQLYDTFVDKTANSIYSKRINPISTTLKEGREKFIDCSVLQQSLALLNILSAFGRITLGCDLTLIGGKAHSGATNNFSSSMSNWKKRYSDVRIIDQSASGLWEMVSENLLENL